MTALDLTIGALVAAWLLFRLAAWAILPSTARPPRGSQAARQAAIDRRMAFLGGLMGTLVLWAVLSAWFLL